MQQFIEILKETVIDSVKLLPFLFFTYLLMEYIEHKMSERYKETVKKSGRLGPIIGSILGIFPQCGFSVSATNLYATRVITLGTLISVYLTTSDEMLPILISESVSFSTIAIILGIKLVIGIIAGFAIDFTVRLVKKDNDKQSIQEICEHDHCHCEKSLIKSTLKHTISIFLYILVITFILNGAIEFIGEQTIADFIKQNIFMGPIITSFIGLIPNCASSVIITELYIEKVISMGTLIAGLLVNAGVGLLVLYKTNRNIKQNIGITILLFLIGAFSGILLEFII